MKPETTTQLNSNQPSTKATFYLRSSVLGGRTIAEYDQTGVRQNSYVFAGGELLAQQQRQTDGTRRLLWEHTNPVTGDGINTDFQGNLVGKATLDPVGVDVGDSDPFAVEEGGGEGGGGEGGMSQSAIDAKVAQLIPGFGGPTAKVDGFTVTAAYAFDLLARGVADFETRTTVWYNGQWNFVKRDNNTGNYIIPHAFKGFTFTGSRNPETGQASGSFHPVFENIVVSSNSSSSGGFAYFFGGQEGKITGQNRVRDITSPSSTSIFDEERTKKCFEEKLKTKFALMGRSNKGDLVVGTFGSSMPFSILIDSTSKTMSDIARESGNPQAMAMSKYDGRGTVYIGSDVQRSHPSDVIDATRVHEVANQIYQHFGTVTGLPKPEASEGLHRALSARHADDDDPGIALEECVFGGYVLGHGRVLK